MLPPDLAAESQVERHFIELATRPLEDHPAVRDEARGELMERLSRQDPSQREAMVEAALARLAKVVPVSWKGKAIGIGVAWLVLTGIAVWLGFGIYHEIRGEEVHEYRWRRYRTGPETTDAAKAKDAVELEAYFVSRTYGGRRVPPNNFHALWTQLDPDNGAWALREATDKAFNWYHSHPRPEGSFEEAWKLVETAAAAPRFEFYWPERRVKEIAALGNPETGIELSNRARLGDFSSFNPEAGIIAELFKEKGRILVAAKDPEGLRATIRTWEKLCLRSASECLRREDLVHLCTLQGSGEVLQKAAADLGMTAEEQKLGLQIAAISENKILRSSASLLPEMSMMARGGYYQDPPPPVEAYKPGRLTEYAAGERILTLGGVGILLLILAVLAIENVRRGRRVNGLASGLSPLFDGKDGLWLIGLGLLAPIGWYWLVIRLTPLGFRDVGFLEFRYPAILVQATAALLLGLVLLIQTAQWRVGVRTRVIGLQPGVPWIGWLMVGMTAALVPAAGIGRWLPPYHIEKFFMIIAASCGIPLLWILWRGGALVFGSNSNALPGVLASRAATFPLLLAIGLLLAANPLLLAIEKNWMAQDQVSGWDAKRGSTIQEARSVDAVVARCRELFLEKSEGDPEK